MLAPKAISRAGFWSFISAMSMRNRTMGIPALRWTFCEFLDFRLLRLGAGHRSADRESCGYELTLVVGGLVREVRGWVSWDDKRREKGDGKGEGGGRKGEVRAVREG